LSIESLIEICPRWSALLPRGLASDRYTLHCRYNEVQLSCSFDRYPSTPETSPGLGHVCPRFQSFPSGPEPLRGPAAQLMGLRSFTERSHWRNFNNSNSNNVAVLSKASDLPVRRRRYLLLPETLKTFGSITHCDYHILQSTYQIRLKYIIISKNAITTRRLTILTADESLSVDVLIIVTHKNVGKSRYTLLHKKQDQWPRYDYKRLHVACNFAKCWSILCSFTARFRSRFSTESSLKFHHILRPFCESFGGLAVGLAIDRSRVQFPAGPLSRNIGQLSLSCLRGR